MQKAHCTAFATRRLRRAPLLGTQRLAPQRGIAPARLAPAPTRPPCPRPVFISPVEAAAKGAHPKASPAAGTEPVKAPSLLAMADSGPVAWPGVALCLVGSALYALAQACGRRARLACLQQQLLRRHRCDASADHACRCCCCCCTAPAFHARCCRRRRQGREAAAQCEGRQPAERPPRQTPLLCAAVPAPTPPLLRGHKQPFRRPCQARSCWRRCRCWWRCGGGWAQTRRWSASTHQSEVSC